MSALRLQFVSGYLGIPKSQLDQDGPGSDEEGIDSLTLRSRRGKEKVKVGGGVKMWNAFLLLMEEQMREKVVSELQIHANPQ